LRPELQDRATRSVFSAAPRIAMDRLQCERRASHRRGPPVWGNESGPVSPSFVKRASVSSSVARRHPRSIFSRYHAVSELPRLVDCERRSARLVPLSAPPLDVLLIPEEQHRFSGEFELAILRLKTPMTRYRSGNARSETGSRNQVDGNSPRH